MGFGLGGIGAVLGGGGALASPFLSYHGQRQTNKSNRQIAGAQMAFQRDMSNSAYQRAVEDMRLAGINPMLAVGQGG